MRGSWAAGWERERGGCPFTHLGWGALRVWGREEGGRRGRGGVSPSPRLGSGLVGRAPLAPRPQTSHLSTCWWGPTHPPSQRARSSLPQEASLRRRGGARPGYHHRGISVGPPLPPGVGAAQSDAPVAQDQQRGRASGFQATLLQEAESSGEVWLVASWWLFLWGAEVRAGRGLPPLGPRSCRGLHLTASGQPASGPHCSPQWSLCH